MTSRYETSPSEFKILTTEQLRSQFLVETLFCSEEIILTYTHYDRLIFGGIMPVNQSIAFPNPNEVRSNYFLERREIGFINIGGKGTITAENDKYDVEKLGSVYLGKGTQDILFSSADPMNPALFFFLSAPAHHKYPNAKLTKEQASPVEMGSPETANHRIIYKYIHEAGMASCQLVMGLTVLQKGSIWNTMPAHTHDRRSEIYCYFDVPSEQAILHIMGQPNETRPLWVHNHQAIISPPWSIHSGAGTANYSFIWGMAGENKDFTDMDFVPIHSLR